MIPAIVLFIISTVVSLVMSHKQQQENVEDNAQKPEEVKTPTLSSSKYIPIVFGTVKLTRPNLVGFNAQYSEKVEKNTGVWIKSNFLRDWRKELTDWVQDLVDEIVDAVAGWFD